jgi:hypothetical protein
MALLGGCARDRLVRQWEFTQGPVPGKMTFGPGDAFRKEMGPPGHAFVISGTYKLEANILKLTITGHEFPGADPGLRKMFAQSFEAVKGVGDSSTITWNGNDEFSLDLIGQQTTMRRKR